MFARRISLFTGLYLFAFIFFHLVNLSLGLKSVDAMDLSRRWLVFPWANPVGGGLLVGCLLLHMVLGLRALYLRNTLRLSYFDAFQLLLGLSIPILLFPHMITMALLPVTTGLQATYQQVLAHFWIEYPWLGLRQVIGLMVVWLHSCMGLFIWMRLQSWWGKVSLFVYPTVVLLPTLALLGFVEAGKEVIAAETRAPSAYQSSRTSQSPYASDFVYGRDIGSTVSETAGNGGEQNSSEAVERRYSREKEQGGSADSPGSMKTTDSSSSSSTSSYGTSRSGGSGHGENYTDGAQDRAESIAINQAMQSAGSVVRMSIYTYLVLLALVLAARAWRLFPADQRVRIKIGDADEVLASSGASLLEISRLHDITHASLCGGKGRCGTCQVAIVTGQENLTAPTEVEEHKLRQIGAADNIRLACQARVSGGCIHLEPMLPAFVVAGDMPHRRSGSHHAEAAAVANKAKPEPVVDVLSEAGD